MIVIVMGVTGCGKSTVGSALAAGYGWPFLDGDDLHSPGSVLKMSAGRPLSDADREPWLDAIRSRMDEWVAAGSHGVVACSALRRAYRDVLRGVDLPGGAGEPGERGDVRFVFLDVAREVLEARLARRLGHFMSAMMLDGQLAILERPGPDEGAVTVKVLHETTPEMILAEVEAWIPRPEG